MKLKPIFIHPAYSFEVYIYREWSIIKYPYGIYIPGVRREFKTIQEATKWIDEQPKPEFKILKEIDSEYTISDLSHYFNGKEMKVSAFLPVMPMFSEKRKVSYIIPGIGENEFTLEPSRFSFYGKYKEMRGVSYTIGSESIHYHGVTYKEGVATLRLPWDSTDPVFEVLNIRNVPKKYIEEFTEFPLSRDLQKQVEKLVYEDHTLPEITEYAFVGEDEEIEWAIVYRVYGDGRKEWALKYKTKRRDEYYRDMKVTFVPDKLKIEEEILRDASDVYEILDFYGF